MIALAVLVTQVTTQSGNGKADARLAASLHTSLAVYRREAADAKRVATRLGRSLPLANALRSGNKVQIQSTARSLAGQYGARALVIRDASGRPLAIVDSRNPAPAYRLNL